MICKYKPFYNVVCFSQWKRSYTKNLICVILTCISDILQELYQNNFDPNKPNKLYEINCFLVRSICGNEYTEDTPCFGLETTTMYTYNSTLNTCTEITYRGCGGTGNLFLDKEECRNNCISGELYDFSYYVIFFYMYDRYLDSISSSSISTITDHQNSHLFFSHIN